MQIDHKLSRLPKTIIQPTKKQRLLPRHHPWYIQLKIQDVTQQVIKHLLPVKY